MSAGKALAFRFSCSGMAAESLKTLSFPNPVTATLSPTIFPSQVFPYARHARLVKPYQILASQCEHFFPPNVGLVWIYLVSSPGFFSAVQSACFEGSTQYNQPQNEPAHFIPISSLFVLTPFPPFMLRNTPDNPHSIPGSFDPLRLLFRFPAQPTHCVSSQLRISLLLDPLVQPSL